MAHAKAAYRIGMVSALMLMLVITLFSRQLALLFTTDDQIIRNVTLSLYLVIFALMPQNGRVVQAGVLRGAGDVKFVACAPC